MWVLPEITGMLFLVVGALFTTGFWVTFRASRMFLLRALVLLLYLCVVLVSARLWYIYWLEQHLKSVFYRAALSGFLIGCGVCIYYYVCGDLMGQQRRDSSERS